MRRFIPGCLLFLQESGNEEEEGAEQSKDSATRNDYAADIIKRGLNKEGWKLVITGKTGFSISHPLPFSQVLGCFASSLVVPYCSIRFSAIEGATVLIWGIVSHTF